MMDINLDPYDVIIATPPCNYWSRANFRRETSQYAQATKHLLPAILDKLCKQDKPFIVENVINGNLFKQHGMYNYPCYFYEHGRHSYWTNIPFNPQGIPQVQDFIAVNKRIKGQRGKKLTPEGEIVTTAGQTKLYLTPQGKIVNSNGVTRVNKNTQGGDNVHHVVEYWLKVVSSWKKGE